MKRHPLERIVRLQCAAMVSGAQQTQRPRSLTSRRVGERKTSRAKYLAEEPLVFITDLQRRALLLMFTLLLPTAA